MQTFTKSIRAWVVTCALICMSTLAFSQVVINEFSPDPGENDGSPSNQTGEFIELYNAGATAVDISGWIIADTDAAIRFPAGSTIAPGAYVLIGSYGLDAGPNGTNGSGISCTNCDFPGVIVDYNWGVNLPNTQRVGNNVVGGACPTPAPSNPYPNSPDCTSTGNRDENWALFDATGNIVDAVYIGQEMNACLAVPKVHNLPAFGALPAISVTVSVAPFTGSSTAVVATGGGTTNTNNVTWQYAGPQINGCNTSYQRQANGGAWASGAVNNGTLSTVGTYATGAQPAAQPTNHPTPRASNTAVPFTFALSGAGLTLVTAAANPTGTQIYKMCAPAPITFTYVVNNYQNVQKTITYASTKIGSFIKATGAGAFAPTAWTVTNNTPAMGQTTLTYTVTPPVGCTEYQAVWEDFISSCCGGTSVNTPTTTSSCAWECYESRKIQICVAPPMVASKIAIACPADFTAGTVNIASLITGGSGITYTLNPGATTNTTGLFTLVTAQASPMVVTVTDASGCTPDITITINDNCKIPLPPCPTLTASNSVASCTNTGTFCPGSVIKLGATATGISSGANVQWYAGNTPAFTPSASNIQGSVTATGTPATPISLPTIGAVMANAPNTALTYFAGTPASPGPPPVPAVPAGGVAPLVSGAAGVENQNEYLIVRNGNQPLDVTTLNIGNGTGNTNNFYNGQTATNSTSLLYATTSYIATLNAGGCGTTTFQSPPASNIVPAGATVLIFRGDVQYPYTFSNGSSCPVGPIYVLFGARFYTAEPYSNAAGTGATGTASPTTSVAFSNSATTPAVLSVDNNTCSIPYTVGSGAGSDGQGSTFVATSTTIPYVAPTGTGAAGNVDRGNLITSTRNLTPTIIPVPACPATNCLYPTNPCGAGIPCFSYTVKPSDCNSTLYFKAVLNPNPTGGGVQCTGVTAPEASFPDNFVITCPVATFAGGGTICNGSPAGSTNLTITSAASLAGYTVTYSQNGTNVTSAALAGASPYNIAVSTAGTYEVVSLNAPAAGGCAGTISGAAVEVIPQNPSIAAIQGGCTGTPADQPSIQAFPTDATPSPTTYCVTAITPAGALPACNATGVFTLPTGTTSATVSMSTGSNNCVTTLVKAIGACPSVPPLAVNLVALSAVVQNESIVVSWATASEENNSHFEVERSLNAINFEKIGTVKGNGTTNTKRSYTFTDANPYGGMNYYRLRQVDLDGKATVSYMAFAKYTSKLVSFEQVYPNPFINELNLVISNAVATEATLSIVDVTGRIVSTQAISLQAGNNSLNLSTTQLAQGIYNLVLRTGKTVVSTRIVK